MTDPVYSWFWQPPIDGRPGLIMIVDNHPDPRRIGIPMAVESLKEVLPAIEAQLPKDIHFGALNIYLRDPVESWIQVTVNPLNRRFTLGEPDVKQASLAELWEARL